MSEAKPFPKSAQLARGERRYRRKIASPKQWQAIIAAKRGPCRVCRPGESDIDVLLRAMFTEYHHLVSRAARGDDVADNIVPVCPACHEAVTQRRPAALLALRDSLTDSERAYVVGKLGEDGLVRLSGATQ